MGLLDRADRSLNAGQPVSIGEKPPEGPACRAPAGSLHLDQFGNARACCQSDLVLGNVTDESLDE
ncbi:MAG: SPASM domain-containing protein, partial [Actinomycetota bacterium]